MERCDAYNKFNARLNLYRADIVNRPLGMQYMITEYNMARRIMSHADSIIHAYRKIEILLGTMAYGGAVARSNL